MKWFEVERGQKFLVGYDGRSWVFPDEVTPHDVAAELGGKESTRRALIALIRSGRPIEMHEVIRLTGNKALAQTMYDWSEEAIQKRQLRACLDLGVIQEGHDSKVLDLAAANARRAIRARLGLPRRIGVQIEPSASAPVILIEKELYEFKLSWAEWYATVRLPVLRFRLEDWPWFGLKDGKLRLRLNGVLYEEGMFEAEGNLKVIRLEERDEGLQDQVRRSAPSNRLRRQVMGGARSRSG